MTMLYTSTHRYNVWMFDTGGKVTFNESGIYIITVSNDSDTYTEKYLFIK